MPSSPSLGPLRRKPRGVASAARGCSVVALSVLAGMPLPLNTGCATFGRRGPVPEQIAACRELSRQGVAAMEIGDWQQAESLLQKALDASPDDAETHRYLAEALWHRGAADDALSHIASAIRLDPADATLVVQAGEMLLARGAHHEALTRAEQAIRLDPKQASAWALRGRVFWRLGQPDRAMADLQRALEIAPHKSDVLLDVVVMYRERGQAARSLATLHHLLDTYLPREEPQMPLLLEGLAMLDLGRPHQAAECLSAASRQGPPNAEVQFRLAQAQLAAGRYAEATTAAEQALAIDASHQASQQLLAQLANRGDPTEPRRK